VDQSITPQKTNTSLKANRAIKGSAEPRALSDTDLVILAAAAAREDGLVLPLPETLKADEAATTKALETLQDRKLITEVPIVAGVDMPLWRRNKTGQRLTLKITDAGLAAIDGEAAKPAAIGAAQTQSAPRHLLSQLAAPAPARSGPAKSKRTLPTRQPQTTRLAPRPRPLSSCGFSSARRAPRYPN
jgi:hypothetical protein